MDLYTIDEAAKSLGIARATLYHQIRLGRFSATKHGRDWFATAAEVERYRTTHLRKNIPAS